MSTLSSLLSLPAVSDDTLDQRAAKLVRLEEAQAKRLHAERLRTSGAPKRHQAHLGLETQAAAGAEWLRAWTRVQSLLKSPMGALIVLLGPRGCGKTQLAVAAMDLVCHSAQARYATAMEIFLELRGSFGPAAKESEKSVLERFCTPGLLVIDESQERGETPFEDRALNFIIDKRYRECLPTIVISNQTAPEFFKAMGASITDRAHEGGAVFSFTTSSFRKESK